MQELTLELTRGDPATTLSVLPPPAQPATLLQALARVSQKRHGGHTGAELDPGSTWSPRPLP